MLAICGPQLGLLFLRAFLLATSYPPRMLRHVSLARMQPTPARAAPSPALQAVSAAIEQQDSALGSCAKCRVPFLCPSCRGVAPNCHKFRTAYQCQHALWTTLLPFMPQVAAAAGGPLTGPAAGAATAEGAPAGAAAAGGTVATAPVSAPCGSASTRPLSS